VQLKRQVTMYCILNQKIVQESDKDCFYRVKTQNTHDETINYTHDSTQFIKFSSDHGLSI